MKRNEYNADIVNSSGVESEKKSFFVIIYQLFPKFVLSSSLTDVTQWDYKDQNLKLISTILISILQTLKLCLSKLIPTALLDIRI